jgi:hypothetical protein
MHLNKEELDGVRLLRADTVDRMVRTAFPDPILRGRRGKIGWGLAKVNVVFDPGALPYPSQAITAGTARRVRSSGSIPRTSWSRSS